MVESCANKITSFLIYNKTIEDKEYDLYLYGFKTLIAFIVNISVILFISYLLNIFKETLLFLLCYCPIRQFTGGYHAENYKRCLLAFISVYLTNIYIIERLVYSNYDYIIMIAMFISYIGICSYAPLEHRNNPLSKEEKQKYKKVARYLTSIIFIFSMIGINVTDVHKYSIYIGIAIICIFEMLIIGIMKQHRGIKR